MVTPGHGLLLVGMLAIGVACARYEPRPIDPAAHPLVYRARRLDDSALVAWVARFAGPVGREWTDRQLAVAALGLRSDVERARRAWIASQAGLRSAGARPQPGVEGTLERALSGSEGASPWVMSLTGLFTLELGGKRAARLQAARGRVAVAESELLLLALDIRARVRAVALALAQAEAVAQERTALAEALGRVELLERGRYQEAALGSSELARTATELAFARSEVAAAERDVVVTRAALAGLLALPPEVLDGRTVRASSVTGCRWADSVGADALARRASLEHGEVGRALAHYAVAEAAVRGAVARQRPDLELGPGFIWDQGVHRWTALFALPALLGFRNRAPVAEAEAERAASAARVAEVQDAVLAAVAEAVATCRGVSAERAMIDSIESAAERQAALARAAYQRGEAGRLEEARAELALARAGLARRETGRRVARAGLALEAAVGAWRGVAPEAWPDPRQAALTPEDGGP